MRVSKQWEVAAPAEAVFDAVADVRSYPEWWPSVVHAVAAADPGPLAVGWKATAMITLGGGPPQAQGYEIRRLERPNLVELLLVRGFLHSRSVWTVAPAASGKVLVRRDFHFEAKGLAKLMLPLMYPGLATGNAIAMRAAMRGLEAYANRPR